MRVLDHHDDLCEAYIRALGQQPVPAMLKEAAWVERDALLDRDFALVLVDENGNSHRKYACYDGGNVDLSTFYLLTQEPDLSVSAVKVAAANLYKAALATGTYPSPILLDIVESPISGASPLDERRVLVKRANVAGAGMGGGLKAIGQAVKRGLGMGAAKGEAAVAKSVLQPAGQAASHTTTMPSSRTLVEAQFTGTMARPTAVPPPSPSSAPTKVLPKATATGQPTAPGPTRPGTPASASETMPLQGAKSAPDANYQKYVANQQAAMKAHGLNYPPMSQETFLRPAPSQGQQAQQAYQRYTQNHASALARGEAQGSAMEFAQFNQGRERELGLIGKASKDIQASKGAPDITPSRTPAPAGATPGAAPAADASHGGNVPGAAPTAHPMATPATAAPSATPSAGGSPVVTPTAGAAAAPTPPAPAAAGASPAGAPDPNQVLSTSGAGKTEIQGQLRQRLNAMRAERGAAQIPAAGPTSGPAVHQTPAAEAATKNQIAAEQQARKAPAPMSEAEAAAQGGPVARDEAVAWEALPAWKKAITPRPKGKAAAPVQAAAPAQEQGVNWMPYAAAAGAGAIGGNMLTNKQSNAPNIFDALQVLEARWADLDPYDRHDMAVEATKEASAVGATVPDHIFRYSGETLSPRFADYMRVRQEYARDPEVCESYGRLAKVAEAIELDELVETVFQLDDMAGLCQRYGEKIADPFLCVFDRVKVAGWSWNHGGLYVTEDDLHAYAASPTKGQMRDLFEDSFVDAFRKSPVNFFKKQSIDVQTILARMASQSGVHNTGGTSIHA